jgi:ABC-type polysaccharide/polyol phosphate export permease
LTVLSPAPITDRRSFESSRGDRSSPTPDVTAAPAPRLVDRAAARPTIGASLISVFSYRELVRNLVLKDLKLKFRGSVLGFLWSLVNPLAMVAVYTFAFKYILASRQPGFPFFVLLGLLAWSFFANSAVMSTGTIIEGGSLVKAVRFPRAVLPLATVLFNLTQYLLTVIVLLPAMFLIYRVPPSGPMLLFPIFLLLQVAFTIGVALILAAATTFFRDVRHFVDIALSLLFWMTPIVYPIDQAPEWLRSALLVSPMTSFVVSYQRIFYDGVWPGPLVWAAALGYGLGVLAIGALWFMAVEDRFGDHL